MKQVNSRALALLLLSGLTYGTPTGAGADAAEAESSRPTGRRPALARTSPPPGLSRALDGLQSERGTFSATEGELRELAMGYLARAQSQAQCEPVGVLAGIRWRPEHGGVWTGVRVDWEGAETPSVVSSRYAQQRFRGLAIGVHKTEFAGRIDGGQLLGRWRSDTQRGELIAFYEQRNDLGGYLFGVETLCGLESPALRGLATDWPRSRVRTTLLFG